MFRDENWFQSLLKVEADRVNDKMRLLLLTLWLGVCSSLKEEKTDEVSPILVYNNPNPRNVTLREGKALSEQNQYLPKDSLNSITRKHSHIMSFDHRQLDLARIEDRVPLDEIIRNLTAMFESLPKALQVATGPNFGSLIRVMHNIKNEFHIMDQEVKTGRTFRAMEDSPIKNISSNEAWLPVNIGSHGEVFRETFNPKNASRTKENLVPVSNLNSAGVSNTLEMRPVAPKVTTNRPQPFYQALIAGNGTKRGDLRENLVQTSPEKLQVVASHPMHNEQSQKERDDEDNDDHITAESLKVSSRVKPPKYKTMVLQGGKRRFRNNNDHRHIAHFAPSFQVHNSPHSSGKTSGNRFANRPIMNRDYVNRKLKAMPTSRFLDAGSSMPSFTRPPPSPWNKQRSKLPPPPPSKYPPVFLAEFLKAEKKDMSGMSMGKSSDQDELRPGQVLPGEILDTQESAVTQIMVKPTSSDPSVQEIRVFTPMAQFVVSSSFSTSNAESSPEMPTETTPNVSTTEKISKRMNMSTSETQRTHIVYSVPMEEYATPTDSSSSAPTSSQTSTEDSTMDDINEIDPTESLTTLQEPSSSSQSINPHDKKQPQPSYRPKPKHMHSKRPRLMGPNTRNPTRVQRRKNRFRSGRGPHGPRANIRIGGQERGIFSQIDQSFRDVLGQLTGWASGMPVISNFV